MKKMMLLAPIFVLFFHHGYSQQTLSTNQQEVLDVINKLFDGYRAGDSSVVSATFAPGAMMQRVTKRDGEVVVTPPASVQRWIDYVGNGLEQVHDEPLWNYTVNINNGLATVWTEFAFYLDGKFSHCGVDNFLLSKTTDGWKIFHIVDTNQKEGCQVPEEIQKKAEK